MTQLGGSSPPPHPGAPEPRFGDVAVAMQLLTPAQRDQLLERQRYLKQLGLSQRIDELAIQMGLMARVDCDFVLGELHRRRQDYAVTVTSVLAKGDVPVAPCRLGDFELEVRLDFPKGITYRAFDRRGQRRVLLKLFPRFLGGDAQWVAGFRRDAGIAARLSHPNILTVYDSGELGGQFYLTMEFAEEELLSAWLGADGRLREADALRITRELACALYHAHVLGLLVRDVRPELVLLDTSGHARIADPGVGKVPGDDPRLVACGLAPEGPHYLAPEQVAGTQAASRATDLYGLGATLYRMLCGRRPFEGEGQQLREAIMHDAQPDPRILIADLSAATCALVGRLMAKDPDDRFPAADAVVAELDRLLGHAAPPPPAVGQAPCLPPDRLEACPTAEPAAAEAGYPQVLPVPRPRPR